MSCPFLTTRQLGDLLGVEAWRIRRLYEDGVLPEPSRFAGKRAIAIETVPAVVDGLRARGWVAGGQQSGLPKPKKPRKQNAAAPYTSLPGQMDLFADATDGLRTVEQVGPQ